MAKQGKSGTGAKGGKTLSARALRPSSKAVAVKKTKTASASRDKAAKIKAAATRTTPAKKTPSKSVATKAATKTAASKTAAKTTAKSTVAKTTAKPAATKAAPKSTTVKATAKTAAKKTAKSVTKSTTTKKTAAKVKAATKATKPATKTTARAVATTAAKPAARATPRTATRTTARPAAKTIVKGKLVKGAKSTVDKRAPAKSTFNKNDLNLFRTTLLEMRERITGQSGSMRQVALTRSDEGNPEEDGTNAFMRLQTLSQISNQHQTLANIDTALHAIEKGTYGSCDLCGVLISKPRLNALPFAKFCINCQSDMESGKFSGR